MWYTPLVDIDPELREFGGQGAGPTRVVEVDVRQQQEADVLHGGTVGADRVPEPGEGRRWPGIDQGQARAGVQQAGPDVARGAQIVEIDEDRAVSECDHGIKIGSMKPLVLFVLLLMPLPALAQTVGTGDPAAGILWDRLSMAGIVRANGKVDSVFIDRRAPAHVISGGDWVSYLCARLGALPIPDSIGIRVAVDSQRILVDGRMVDLPPETRNLFGPLLMLVDPTTVLRAEVVMAPTGPGVVRFVLATISVNGIQIPESVLGMFLMRLAQRYPVLTKTGRELLVAVPQDGKVNLVNNGVRLWIDENAPKPASPPR